MVIRQENGSDVSKRGFVISDDVLVKIVKSSALFSFTFLGTSQSLLTVAGRLLLFLCPVNFLTITHQAAIVSRVVTIVIK